MIHLIRKDFSAGRYVLIGCGLIILFISVLTHLAMIGDFGGVIIGISILITCALCIAASFVFIGIDETVHAEMIYASLPVKRSTIVRARYGSAYLMTLIGFIIVLLACLGCIHIFRKNDPAFSLYLSLRGSTALLSFLWLILSFMLPFTMRWGGSKGMTAALVTQISVFVILPVIKFLLSALSGMLEFDIGLFIRVLQVVLRWFIDLKAIYAYLLVLAIHLLVILFSMVLSVRFYDRRDL